MRKIKTLNMIEGQKIESDETLKKIGDLTYRSRGIFEKMGFFDDGKAIILGSGLRVEASVGMTVNVPSGATFQRIHNTDVISCIQIVDQTVTLDASDGSPRVDIIEATIKMTSDKTDYDSNSLVQTASGSLTVSNIELKRDIKYSLEVRKRKGTTTSTPGTAGTLTGIVAIAGTIDLTDNYLLNIRDGEDADFIEIDCRGVDPTATSIAEIVGAINSSTGRTMATIGVGDVVVLTGVGLGMASYFMIKPPFTDADKDGLLTIFGTSSGGLYRYTIQGTNEYFKLAEIDVGALTTVITTGLIRNVDKKSTWASEGSDVLLNNFKLKDGYIQGGIYNPNSIIINSDLEVNTQNYINGTDRLELTLPEESLVGEKISIVDIGSRGWSVLQNASQYIIWMNKITVPGTVGYPTVDSGIESKSGYASVELACIVEDTAWIATKLRDVISFKGYIMGGYLAAAATDVIEDLNFKFETSNVITAELDTETQKNAGISSFLKGYSLGGEAPGYAAVIDDLIFSDESSQAIAAELDTPKSLGAGVSGNFKGYILGGLTGAGVVAVIEDLIFSDESSQAIVAALNAAKHSGTGVQSNTKGYILGGNTGAVTDVIDSLIFSTDLREAVIATLNTPKELGAGISGSLKGYILGGNTGAVTAVIEDLIFSDESSQAITATLSAAKQQGTGISGSLKGYCMGGNTGAVTAVIEDLDLTIESSEIILAELTPAKRSGAGVQGYN